MATTRKFTDIVGDIDSDRRAHIDALKDEPWPTAWPSTSASSADTVN